MAAAREKERTHGRDAKRCKPGGSGALTTAARRLDPPRNQASLAESAPTVAQPPGTGPLRPPSPPRRPPSPGPRLAQACPLSHTHRARARLRGAAARRPRRDLRPAPCARPVDWAPRGGVGATSRARALSERRQRPARIVTGSVCRLSLETGRGLGGAERRQRQQGPWRSQDAIEGKGRKEREG